MSVSLASAQSGVSRRRESRNERGRARYFSKSLDSLRSLAPAIGSASRTKFGRVSRGQLADRATCCPPFEAISRSA